MKSLIVKNFDSLLSSKLQVPLVYVSSIIWLSINTTLIAISFVLLFDLI